MTRHRLVELLVCGLAITALCSCDKLQKLTNKEDKTAASIGKAGGGGGGGGQSEDDALGEKLNYYIECINTVSGRAEESASRYASWLDDPQKGPTGKEKRVYTLYKLNDPKSCLEALDKAAAAKPKLEELDKAGQAYAAALKGLMPLLDKAYDYYQQGDYKDDKFAKGIEMHGPLWAAFTAFHDANVAMRKALDKEQSGLQERELARMEKENGRDLQFLRALIMHRAEAVFLAGRDEAPNVEELDARLKDYIAAKEELDALLAKDPSQKEQFSMWSMFESKPADFLKAAKDRFRRVRDKVPYSTGEKMNVGGSSEWMVEGSPGALLRAYNELVDASNRLN